MGLDADELPRDPDWDAVPESLAVLCALDGGRVVVMTADGVSREVLTVCPGLFAAAQRMMEGE